MAGPEAKARSPLAWLRYVTALAALIPAQANAGAWIAPEGGQEIITSVAGERNGVRVFESAAYWEVPLGERTSVVAAPWVEQNYDTYDGWRGEATLSVKRVALRRGDTVVAVQAGALWASHPDEGCGEGGGEARILAGRNIGSHAFANAEVAGRALSGGCGGARLDLTVGYRPRENWLAMAQTFVDASREGEEAIRAQITMVRFSANGRGVQLGVRARLDGDDAEPALVFALWGRPGSDREAGRN